jgi:hypothetical protein
MIHSHSRYRSSHKSHVIHDQNILSLSFPNTTLPQYLRRVFEIDEYDYATV